MPLPDENDDWAELARELARDKPQPLPADESSPPEDTGVFDEGLAESTDTESEDAPDGAGETEAEAAPDGQPGTGRKRRRRRRRRRRGGSDQPADATADAGSPEGEEAAEAAESEPAEGDFEASEVGFADESEAEPDTELVSVDSESDEDAGEDLLRDLIANWNVPSWDDVVGGLYRPER